jgi:hypothetical protein
MVTFRPHLEKRMRPLLFFYALFWVDVSLRPKGFGVSQGAKRRSNPLKVITDNPAPPLPLPSLLTFL